jgi:tetratricopeptide (TPR) repeat protein
MSAMTTIRCGTEGCEKQIAALQQELASDAGSLALHYQLGLCYSGLCRPHSLISPEAALEHLRWSATESARAGDELFRAKVLTLLGITYMRATSLPRNARLRAAMQCQEEAAKLYFSQSRFDAWARLQFNLGNTWCEISEHDYPDKWEQAIAHYERALMFRTEETDAHGFAVTMENLGSAYRERKQGDKAANVRKAIRCYRRAARVCGMDAAPGLWAGLQNNLGNAYLSLPARGPAAETALARRAILHFDLALRVRTLERSRLDYGITQLNRGQAYLRLGLAESAAELAESARAFREAQGALLQAGRSSEAEMAARGSQLAAQALNEFPQPQPQTQ